MCNDWQGALGIERGFQTRAEQTETRTRLRQAVGRAQQAEGRRDFRPDLGLSQLYAVEHRGHVERLEKHPARVHHAVALLEEQTCMKRESDLAAGLRPLPRAPHT